MRYVPEIDGLRAVAVLTVVFFHLDFVWIPAGFLGVDIFFVISGYLVTQILLRESDKAPRDFFRDFYLRRLRRIFPALFLVVFVTLVMGAFILLPEDLLELSNSALATLGFVSNIYFYFNTGYFDAPAETMALLHTWSLAVEEQFYLFWPVIILLISSRALPIKQLVVAAVFLASLSLSVLYTTDDAALAFYNLPFRIFEFMLGAGLALLPLSQDGVEEGQPPVRDWRVGALLQVVGLVMLYIAVRAFSPQDNFPGYLALLPAAGSALFILGAVHFAPQRFNPMRASPVVFVGKISYSLYLWHWPMVTLYKVYADSAELDLGTKLILFVAMVVAATGSFYLVERPLRRPTHQRSALRFTGLSAGLIVLVALGYLQTNGLEQRVVIEKQYASTKIMWNWRNGCDQRLHIQGFERRLCAFGEPWRSGSRKIVLWGDSHALQIGPLFKDIANQWEIPILLVGDSCRPIADGERILMRDKIPVRATEGCLGEIGAIHALLERDANVELVVLTGLWARSAIQAYTKEARTPTKKQALGFVEEGLEFNVARLREMGVDVLLLGDLPSPGRAKVNCATRHDLWRATELDCSPLLRQRVDAQQGPTEAILQRIASRHARVWAHDVRPTHCDDTGCPIFVNGDYLYRDTNHLRRNLKPKTRKALIASIGLRDAIDWSAYGNLAAGQGAARQGAADRREPGKKKSPTSPTH